jgi:hypothetical protein
MFDKIKRVVVLLVLLFSASGLLGDEYKLLIINDCKKDTITFLRFKGSKVTVEPGLLWYLPSVGVEEGLQYKRSESGKTLNISNVQMKPKKNENWVIRFSDEEQYRVFELENGAVSEHYDGYKEPTNVSFIDGLKGKDQIDLAWKNFCLVENNYKELNKAKEVKERGMLKKSLSESIKNFNKFFGNGLGGEVKFYTYIQVKK